MREPGKEISRKPVCRGLEKVEGKGAAGNESLNLGDAEASFYLGDLDPEEMPGIALRAPEAGYDGPALLKLARMGSATMQNAGDLFGFALGEVGRAPLPEDEAGLRMARNVARKTISGEMHPYEGACLLWVKVWNKCGRPDELTPFVGLASPCEADPERRPFHLGEIVERAKELADEREDN